LSDIGFSEILLLVAIALIVIGPKRLPEAARFLGYWIGKLRRSLQNARRDMERELGIDDIRREVHNQLLLEQLESERQQVAETLKRAQEAPPAPREERPESPEDIEFIDDVDGEDAGPTRATGRSTPERP
jgi:sec-independent protein translocase protein TatB